MPILFVQFLHPGREHSASTGTCWNAKAHRRKFLRSPGRHLRVNSIELNTGDIAFWGEWEAESEIDASIADPIPQGPHRIFAPYYVQPRDYAGLQNTDPFVFGKRFFYSNCLQPSRPLLRSLTRGSVILFGSSLAGQFVLDTVFVVSQRQPLGPESIDRFEGDEGSSCFVDVTLRPLFPDTVRSAPHCTSVPTSQPTYRSTCEGDRKSLLTLYYGATFDEPVGEMFSFVPCLPATEAPRGFARPRITLDEITDGLTQNCRATELDTVATATTLWRRVRAQVEEAGLSAGVTIDHPPLRKRGQRCSTRASIDGATR